MTYTLRDLTDDLLGLWPGEPARRGFEEARIAASERDNPWDPAGGFAIDGLRPDGDLDSAELSAFVSAAGHDHAILDELRAELAGMIDRAKLTTHHVEPVADRFDRDDPRGSVEAFANALTAAIIDAREDRDEARDLARRRRDERNIAVRRLRHAAQRIAVLEARLRELHLNASTTTRLAGEALGDVHREGRKLREVST